MGLESFPKVYQRFFGVLIVASAACCHFSLGPFAYAAVEISPAREKEIAALLPAKPVGVGQPISDRDAWDKLAKAPGFSGTIKEAEGLAKTPALPWSNDLYLDYSRTGRRSPGEKMLHDPRRRLEAFVLAECLENRGRFIAPAEAMIAAICAQPCWVYPAHDGGLTVFRGRSVDIDLGAVAAAWELATADYLLGDKLSKSSRTLIHENLERRILKPFRDMVEGRRSENGWMRRENNWNAVCLAGVTGAALESLDSREDRAWFIAAAEHYIRYFLASFTPDGYCSEGVGYWNYGYGHFLMLTETIRQATAGKIDLLAEPAAVQPALFGRRAEIINGMFPTISDVHPGAQPASYLNRYIAERLGIAGTSPRGEIFRQDLGGLFSTALFAFAADPLPPAHQLGAITESPLRSWFTNGGVLICRPTPDTSPQFAAVLKGGHNAEQHNHNDVGSFSVVLGKTMLICDPGAERYTARTFSSKRYESQVLSSFGHAVPVVAGKLQSIGAKARAAVLRSEFTDAADTLALDIHSAYEVPELKKLERTFVFQRGNSPSLTVRDDVSFDQPERFETALVTWSDWKKASNTELIIGDGEAAVRVKIDAGGQPLEIKVETLNEDVTTPRKPTRIGIALKSPVKSASVTLNIILEKDRARSN